MVRAHRAYAALVRELLNNIADIEAHEKKTARDRFMQDRIVYPTRRGWPLAPVAEACARIDSMATVESYIQQKRERPNAGEPVIEALESVQPEYADALDHLAVLADHKDREDELRDEINRLSRTPRPRPLGLYGYKSFYRLLRHPGTNRLYAWINIRPKSSRFTPRRKHLNAELKTRNEQEMVDVSTGELVLCDKPGWVLFPLSFGFDYHERRFLAAADPKGARIVYKAEADRYELHVTFAYRRQQLQPRVLLGVDRGIYNLAAWAVSDSDGRTIDEGRIDGRGLRHVQRHHQRWQQAQQRKGRIVKSRKRRAYADEAVHVTANALVRLATQHQAQLVLEQLQARRVHARPKYARRSSFNHVLNRQQYQKLKQVLEYKTRANGLPGPRYVGAPYTSQTCPACAHVSSNNRVKRRSADGFEMSTFRCERCGHEADADVNAARVIALKGAWLGQLRTRGKRPLREDEKFPQYLADAAERRRGSGEAAASVPS